VQHGNPREIKVAGLGDGHWGYRVTIVTFSPPFLAKSLNLDPESGIQLCENAWK
jgi:hypothetical protein